MTQRESWTTGWESYEREVEAGQLRQVHPTEKFPAFNDPEKRLGPRAQQMMVHPDILVVLETKWSNNYPGEVSHILCNEGPYWCDTHWVKKFTKVL